MKAKNFTFGNVDVSASLKLTIEQPDAANRAHGQSIVGCAHVGGTR